MRREALGVPWSTLPADQRRERARGMSNFDKMNVDEREPFDFYVVRQQNRALAAALHEKDRKIDELKKAVQDYDRQQRSTVAMVSCVERHWYQVRGGTDPVLIDPFPCPLWDWRDED